MHRLMRNHTINDGHELPDLRRNRVDQTSDAVGYAPRILVQSVGLRIDDGMDPPLCENFDFSPGGRSNSTSTHRHARVSDGLPELTPLVVHPEEMVTNNSRVEPLDDTHVVAFCEKVHPCCDAKLQAFNVIDELLLKLRQESRRIER